jgi:hypothetical protein
MHLGAIDEALDVLTARPSRRTKARTNAGADDGIATITSAMR